MILLVHINMSICLYLLVGKKIVRWTFGELWPAETQHTHGRILSFFFFKTIFISAVMDPIWNHISMWIGVLGFMRVFSLISRDRLDHLTAITFVSTQRYCKIILLLSTVLFSNILWYLGSFYLFPTSFAFLTLEFLPVLLDTLQILVEYVNQFWSQWVEDGLESQRWLNCYADLSADALRFGCTLWQYLLLMWMHGVSFGVVDIVLLLNVKNASKTLYNKMGVYWERWKTMTYIRQRFVDASPEELSILDDKCAICRENMKTAKKLTCGHVFHLQCLFSWVQCDASESTCPTCRRSLSTNTQLE
ncbi:unnamed protein product [Rhizopus stolonifer]